MFISSHMVAGLVFIHGSSVDFDGKPSETDGESVGCGTGEQVVRLMRLLSSRWEHSQLVSMRKRLEHSRCSAETLTQVSKQTACPGPSGLTIRGYFEKFNRTTAWMLQQVETSVDDPIITDNTVMTRAEKRFLAQAYCVLVLNCRGNALQVVQRVPRGFGFQADMISRNFQAA